MVFRRLLRKLYEASAITFWKIEAREWRRLYQEQRGGAAFDDIQTQLASGAGGAPPAGNGIQGDGPYGTNPRADAFTNSLGNRSMSQCGRYRRQVVGAITGDPYFNRQIGGHASSGGTYLVNSGRFTPRVNNGIYNNGDTRIYQGGRNGYGHRETYYNGNWYSDFKQSGPLTSKVGSYYSSATLYRIK